MCKQGYQQGLYLTLVNLSNDNALDTSSLDMRALSCIHYFQFGLTYQTNMTTFIPIE